MESLEKVLPLISAGAMLGPEQFLGIEQFLASCRRMKAYLKRGEYLQSELAFYGRALCELNELESEIERCIRGETVDSNASPALRDIRRRMEMSSAQVKAKLLSLLQSNRTYYSDSFVATRGGRLTLPVKREHRAQVPGTVVDMSSTGSTVFIEPASVTKLQEELSDLTIQEENEVRRILYSLTALAETCLHSLEMNRDTFEALDFAFAKGILSAQMDAIEPEITTDRRLCIENGRHPLISKDNCVPLHITMGGEVTGIVVTGPNTGGKTVALKTVGLLSLMAQSGLHVPAEKGTVLCMFANVLCDIGDGQSISQNLSTFSAHMTNILSILKETGRESLVLLDELGSGTDPMEGMGMAISILDVLREKKCLFVATTHYPEVKEYAYITPGLTNARMAFDRETLSPLYRLEMGEAGESCALYIVKRLGFPEAMISRAREAAYNRQDAQRPFAVLPPKEQMMSGADTALIPRIQRDLPPKPVSAHAAKFQLGDSVMVYPSREIGLVYDPADEKGLVGVQVKGVKSRIPHKRLKLHVAAESMYPDNYDFSIVFDSVENRKARHQMNKHHRPDLQIQYEKEQPNAND
jgi:dsDNA-specific endonuclease/ATPase MutS2